MERRILTKRRVNLKVVGLLASASGSSGSSAAGRKKGPGETARHKQKMVLCS